MLSMRCLGIVMTMGLMWGCAPKSPPTRPAEPPPPNSDQVLALREQLKHNDPNAQVGQVREVMPQNKLLAVDDVPVQDFPLGQAVVIADGRLNTVARGVVENVEGRIVVVKYEAVKRDPRKGDLAIRQSERPGMAPEAQAPEAGGNVTTLPPPNTNPTPSDNTATSPATRPADTNPPTGNTGAPEGNPAPATRPAPPDNLAPAPTKPANDAPADLKPADLNK